LACEDPLFLYTLPDKTLAPKMTTATGIKGKSAGVEVNSLTAMEPAVEAVLREATER
jgi:hypothetical protein